MRTWVKATIAGVALVVLGFAALAGTGAYYVFRSLETRSTTEAESRPDFDAVRAKFKNRPPLVEVANLKAGDVRVQRTTHPAGLKATTLFVLSFNEEDGKLLRTNVPLWLARFSSINILSKLGVAPERFRLTVDDLAAFGPGIVVDYRQPGQNPVLIWVE